MGSLEQTMWRHGPVLLVALLGLASSVLALESVNCPLGGATKTVTFIFSTNQTERTINAYSNCESTANCLAKTCIPGLSTNVCGGCSAFAVTENDPYFTVTVSATEASRVTVLSDSSSCVLNIDPTTVDSMAKHWFFGAGCQPASCNAHQLCNRCVLDSGCSWCGDYCTETSTTCPRNDTCSIVSVTTMPINTDDGYKRTSAVFGDSFYFWDGEWWVKDEFIYGANLGISEPGYFPGEMHLSYDDYITFFNILVDGKFDAFRCYTLLSPHFYRALHDFNKNRKKPLWYFQGVWSPEEELINGEAGADAFTEAITTKFKTEIKRVIQAVHGSLKLDSNPGGATGEWTYDVSPYVAGWIIGTEWHQNAVKKTNDEHPTMSSLKYDDPLYQWDTANLGRPFQYIQPSDDAKPMEIWVSLMMDFAAHIDMSFGWQRPMAVTNWLCTDPLYHRLDPGWKKEDLVSFNSGAIRPTYRFTAGYYLAYHIYPYYPDAQRYEYADCVSCSGKKDPYAGYLSQLREFHNGSCLIVTEYGVPTSRGRARKSDQNGLKRDQGGLTEKEQGTALVEMTIDIMEQGYQGAWVFQLVDEWFKKCWNTWAVENEDSRSYWYNALTSETGFGIISTHPARHVVLDGNTDDWPAKISQNMGKQCSSSASDVLKTTVAHDEGYVYLLVEKPSDWDFTKEQLYIGFDVIPSKGSSKPKNAPASFSLGLENLMVINGPTNGSLTVKSDYDIYFWWYGTTAEPVPVEWKDYGIGESDRFNEEQMISVGQMTVDCKIESAIFFPLGKMIFGTTDRKSQDYNSQSDFFYKGNTLEIRIPWAQLGIVDPPNRAAAPYPTEKVYFTDEIKEIPALNFQTMLVSGGSPALQSSCDYVWNKWKPTDVQYEMAKKQSFDMLVESIGPLVDDIPRCSDFSYSKCQRMPTSTCNITHQFDTPSTSKWSVDNPPAVTSQSSTRVTGPSRPQRSSSSGTAKAYPASSSLQSSGSDRPVDRTSTTGSTAIIDRSDSSSGANPAKPKSSSSSGVVVGVVIGAVVVIGCAGAALFVILRRKRRAFGDAEQKESLILEETNTKR